MYYIKKNHLSSSTVSLLMLCATLFCSTYLSDDLSAFVKEGLTLCINSIIGAVFPFIIITDLLFNFSEFERITPLRKAFEKLFKINGRGVSAFICGAVCGFPLGVKVSYDLYKKGAISKDECERLISFANNTGPAFIVCGIGIGMRDSLRDGVILYSVMIISAIFVGIVSGFGKKVSTCASLPLTKEFNLVNSISKAGLNTLNICSFITFFSVICGILSLFLPSGIYHVVLPFIEVGNASKILSASHLPPIISLALTSFAVSFSGVSVMVQSVSLIDTSEVSIKKYTLAKLLQGCISMVLSCAIYTIVNRADQLLGS